MGNLNWLTDSVLFENNNEIITKINEILVGPSMPVVAWKEMFLQCMALRDHSDYCSRT